MAEEPKQRGHSRLPRGQERVPRGHGRVVFLAKLDEITQSLAEGYPAKAIWETLHNEGVMPIQYRTFAAYVSRLILNENKTSKENDKKGKDKIETKESKTQEIKKEPEKNKAQKVTGSFEYNARSKSKDELI